MSQNNSNDKILSLQKISSIHQVEDFNPEDFVVEFTDLATGEVRKRLPVMIQMAWFRLCYPEGRISVQVSTGRDCFVATARVYPSYKDPADYYLAEATASRGPDPNKPSVSPREWAQTAAVGIALRNAGFGLQFAAAGEDFEGLTSESLPVTEPTNNTSQQSENVSDSSAQQESAKTPSGSDEDYETVSQESSEDQKLNQAFKTPCPIKKFSDKTLGELLEVDPKALNWIATKFTGDAKIQEAAKMICEYAVQQASA